MWGGACVHVGIKALQAPLPLPEPFDNMWGSITKANGNY